MNRFPLNGFLLTDWALIHCLLRVWGMKTEDEVSKANIERSSCGELRKSWHRREVAGGGRMERDGRG